MAAQLLRGGRGDNNVPPGPPYVLVGLPRIAISRLLDRQGATSSAIVILPYSQAQ